MAKTRKRRHPEGKSTFMDRARKNPRIEAHHREVLRLAGRGGGIAAEDCDGRALRYLRNRKLVVGTRTVVRTAAGTKALQVRATKARA